MARKPSFSERAGLTTPRAALQIGAVDDELRTRLYNALHAGLANNAFTFPFVVGIWRDVLVRKASEISKHLAWHSFETEFAKLKWNKVYEVTEYAAEHYPQTLPRLAQALELGGSGYRLVDGIVVAIVDEQQIGEIETALSTTATPPLNGVQTHLNSALALYADRVSPDYRNSVKESISALEALVNLINGRSGGKTGKTLGDALKSLGDLGGEVHPAMAKGLGNLYGWTSDSGGIRHYLKDETVTPGSEEARFMLVTVSALVNFLVTKAAKVGIDVVSPNK